MSTTTYKMFIIKTLRLVPGATEVNDNRTRQGLQWSRLTLTKTIRRAQAGSTRRVLPAVCVKLHTAQHSRQRPEAGGGTKQALPTQREKQQKSSVYPSGRRAVIHHSGRAQSATPRSGSLGWHVLTVPHSAVAHTITWPSPRLSMALRVSRVSARVTGDTSGSGRQF